MQAYNVQVNGKTRATVDIPPNTDVKKAREIAASNIQGIIKGHAVKRVIFTSGVINFVV